MLFGAAIVALSTTKARRGKSYGVRPFSGHAVSIRMGASDPLQLPKEFR